VGLLLLAAGCARSGSRATEAPPRVDVIAHRGASADAPENTPAAFRRAVELGADWFECDVTRTKDGRLVMIHDDTVDRTTDGRGRVADLTFDEVRRLDAGSWKGAAFAGERIPTLEETLELAGGRSGAYVEIKAFDGDETLATDVLRRIGNRHLGDPEVARDVLLRIEATGSPNLELTRAVVRVVRERRANERVVLQSFSPVICAILLLEAPELRVEFLVKAPAAEPERWESARRWVRALGVRGVNVGADGLTEARVAELRAAGLSVGAWTVDDPAEIVRLVRWGVVRVITNRPDTALAALAGAGFRGGP
jgi:glycerophosphoryl diester phosphodiesterase